MPLPLDPSTAVAMLMIVTFGPVTTPAIGSTRGQNPSLTESVK